MIDKPRLLILVPFIHYRVFRSRRYDTNNEEYQPPAGKAQRTHPQ